MLGEIYRKEFGERFNKIGCTLKNAQLKGSIIKSKSWKSRLNKFTFGLPLVIAFFIVWELAPRIGLLSPIFFPPFSEVVLTLIHLTQSGELFVHVEASLQRSIIGFTLATIIAIPLGFLMGWYSRFEKYADLLIQGLRNTSLFALMPLFILILGIGEASKIGIVFYAAVWYLLINTISGVKCIDPLYIKAARSMGTSDADLFKKIILPACIPSIISGARLAAKSAVMVVIAAEMLAAKSGLGYYVQNAQLMMHIPEMYAGILTLAMIGLTVNYALVWIEKSATYWKGDVDAAIL